MGIIERLTSAFTFAGPDMPADQQYLLERDGFAAADMRTEVPVHVSGARIALGGVMDAVQNTLLYRKGQS
jgi:hypothetical protein